MHLAAWLLAAAVLRTAQTGKVEKAPTVVLGIGPPTPTFVTFATGHELHGSKFRPHPRDQQ